AKRAEVADKFWALLQAAEPGSDAQLTIARSTIAALASTPDASGTSRLNDMLQEGIRGLLLSLDLRWSIIQALTARDALPQEVLEQQREDDISLSGADEYLGQKYAYPAPKLKRYHYDEERIPQAHSNAEVV